MPKLVIVVILLLVLAALFTGLYFLFRDVGKGERALKALFFRIGFTLTLIVVLLTSVYMGWIQFHPV